jgi:hypothetical protein
MAGPYSGNRSARRRGHVVVLAAVSLTLLIGFAALAIDLGQIYVVRAELQRAADAAALAGASSYFSDAGLVQNLAELGHAIETRSQEVSLANQTHNAETILDLPDIVIGTYDFDFPDAALDASGAVPFNAVQITTRRTAASSNGPIAMFFGGIFGVDERGVIAEATAVADDRFRGLRLDEEIDFVFIPLTMRESHYEYLVVNGNDDYSYDGEVYESGDAIPEVRLYPWRLFPGTPADPWDDVFEMDDEGAGTFGVLEFTGSGAATTADRILNGVSAEELREEVGTSELTFYDEEGNPTTYPMTGAPGIQAAAADALEQRLGQVVGFFVHDQVTGTGTNVEYRIVGVRFGRLMGADLRGDPSQRDVVVQPVAYSGPGVIISTYVPSSGGYMGRAVLVK